MWCIYKLQLAAASCSLSIVATKASISTKRADHTAFLMNNRIYITGGVKSSTELADSSEVYDLSSFTTVPAGSAVMKTTESACASLNDMVIHIGGRTLEIRTGSTTTKAKMVRSVRYSSINAAGNGIAYKYELHLNYARAGAGTVIHDGKIYVIGGYDEYGLVKAVEAIDLGWKEKASPPVSLKDPMTISHNETIYVMGGYEKVNGSDVQSRSVYCYNTQTNTWSRKSDLPFYVTGGRLVSSYGKIYLVGGIISQNGNPGQYATSLYEYDPTSDTWSQKSALARSVSESGAVGYKNKVYIAGGQSTSGMVSSVQVYDPVSDTCVLKNSLPAAMSGLSMHVIDNTMFAVKGSNQLYRYDESTDTWAQLSPAGSTTAAQIYGVISSSLFSVPKVSTSMPQIYKYSKEENAWSSLHTFNMPIAMQEMVAVNGKLYIFTGSGYLSGLVEYTPSVSSWTYMSSMPTHMAHGGAVYLNGKIYAGGGSESPRGFAEYDVMTNTWTSKASMTYEHIGGVMAAASNKIYMIGGEDASGTAVSYVEEYNPQTNTWTAKKDIPGLAILGTPIKSITGAAVNDKIYIFGGRSLVGTPTNRTLVYDPVKNTWTTLTSMPTARYSASAASANGKIYVAGGITSSITNPSSKAMEVYDPATGVWTKLSDMPTAVSSMGGAGTSDGVYFVEGTSTYEYSIAANGWTTWDGPNFIGSGISLVAIEKGLYALGGKSEVSTTNTVEFSPVMELYNEYRRMGSDEINLSGNFSRTYVDMSVETPGFTLNISRTYNSKDMRTDTLLGRGWTFGFEGKLTNEGKGILMRLPDGSGYTFRYNADGTYYSKDSRGTLVKQSDSSHIYTTKDGYSYGFNKDGYLVWMKDRNGNTVTITVNSAGKISKVTDPSGRTYTIAYRGTVVNGNTDTNTIKSITDNFGRSVTYEYDTNNRLISVSGPNVVTSYTYDDKGYLQTSTVNGITESITYYPTSTVQPLPRVNSVSANSMLTTYTYIDSDGKLEMKDTNSRVTSVWYDKSLYPIRTVDADGRESRTVYYQDGGVNYYGEVYMDTDRNGNSTYYERDDKGNVTKVINQDGSTREYTYDTKDNVTSEKDEEGKMIYYVYDTQKVNLVKKVRPLDGVMPYTETANQSLFSIESTTYYTAAESLSMCGRTIYGLVKTVTNGESGTVTYKYDGRGYVSEIRDSLGNTTKYTYNSIGFLIKETSPSGYVTNYYYDQGGLLLKKVTGASIGDVSPTVYVWDKYNRDSAYRYEPVETFYDWMYNYDEFSYKYFASGYDIGGDYRFSLDNSATYITFRNRGSLIYFADALYRDPVWVIRSSAVYKLAMENKLYYKCGTTYHGTVESTSRTAYPDDNYSGSYWYKYNSAREVGSETYRYIYNNLGQLTQYIEPNEYSVSYDAAVFTSENILSSGGTYSGTTQGYRYIYNTRGQLTSKKDPLNNTTSYTYDLYDNILTETLPNGGVNVYTYDVMNRLKTVSFKETSASTLLKDYTYTINSDGTTKVSEKVYLNTTETAVTATTYDYAGRVIRTDNADGTNTRNEYYRNGLLKAVYDARDNATHYRYNGMNLLSDMWSAAKMVGATVMYEYRGFIYDKCGRVTRQNSGKDTVTLYTIPTNIVWSASVYNTDSTIKEINDSAGRRTVYTYDADKHMSKEEVYTSATDKNTTEYNYNHRGKVTEKKVYTNASDIYGQSGTGTVYLTTGYIYDKNGNILTITNPDGVVTTNTYDLLNRLTRVSQPGRDEYNANVTITTELTYTNMGQIGTTKDANGNVTAFTYDKRGNVTHKTDAAGGVSYYTYDRAGRLTAEVTPKNYITNGSITQMNRTEYTYDLMSRVLRKTQVYRENGSSTWKNIVVASLQYDANGNKTRVYDALGYQNGYYVSFEYDLMNRQIRGTDAENSTVTYEYDGLGRMVKETDPRGYETTYTYDDAGNVTQAVAGSISIIKTYDKIGNVLTEKDGNGNVTTYTYNSLGEVRTVTLPSDTTVGAYTVTYRYTMSGQTASESDSLNKEVLYSYDNQGRNLSVTERKTDGTHSITVSCRYDKNGNLRYDTDGNGNVTSYVYDSLNRAVSSSITVNGLVKTAYKSYDNNGNVLTETNWLGNITKYEYDALNRSVKTINALNAVVETLVYNLNGAQVSSTDAMGNVTSFEYDRVGRLKKTTDGEGHSTRVSYDANGNVVGETDGKGSTVTKEYDRYNRLTSVKNPSGAVISSYTYDSNGNLLTQKDGANNTTTYTYNVRSLPITRVVTGGSTERYTYRADGSVNTYTDRMNRVFTYSYDIHGRLLSKVNGSNAISYTYDNNGNQLTMVDSTGITTRTYDSQNRVKTKTVPVAGTTVFAYDITAGLTTGYCSEKTTDPKGNVVTRTYDKVGRLYSVHQGTAGTTSYTYNNNGTLNKVTYPGGATEEYTYYRNNKLKTLTNKKANGTVIDAYNYSYDANGNITQKLDGLGTTVYTYDSMNRLLTVTEPGGKVITYTYDSAGNRKTESVKVGSTTTVTTYNYDSQNRLTSKVTGSVTTSYTYDANGNQLTESTGGVVTTNTYDVWNNLTKTVKGSVTVTNTYNGDGLRVKKVSGSSTSQYVYEYDKVILELDGSGNQKAANVYGKKLVSRVESGTPSYYLYNGHGDVTTILNASGTVIAGYYYDAFGVQLDVSGNVSNPYRYSGYVYDEETNLYYLNSRFYSPETARFLQEDSYRGNIRDPLSLNLYAYVNYNPLVYYDPSGHALAGNGTMTAIDRLAIVRAQEQYDKSYAIYSSDKYTAAARENAHADMLAQMAIIDQINQSWLKEYEAWLKTQPTSTKDSNAISDMPTIVVTVTVENSSSTSSSSSSSTSSVEKTYTYTVLNGIMYEVVGTELIRVETDILIPSFGSSGASLESDVHVMIIISEVIVNDIVSKVGSAGEDIAQVIVEGGNDTSAEGKSAAAWFLFPVIFGFMMLLTGCEVEREDTSKAYASADEAAKAFAEEIYSSSLYSRHEYGAEIYSKVTNGFTDYYYTSPHVGLPHSVTHFTNNIPSTGTYVAPVHTHPNGSDFSATDMKNAINNERNSYVAIPSLEVLRYDYSSGVTTSIGTFSPTPLTQDEKDNLEAWLKYSWENHFDSNGNCDKFDCEYMAWPNP